MHPKNLTIALAGNPNSGKTTIFNIITGTRQKVGNWPGVTVEKKEGRIHKFGHDLKVIDLPGTYSLTPYSIEEIVARNYILDERPDVVVAMVDAAILERSLYLVAELLPLPSPVIVGLNMIDVARKRGIEVDAERLARELGCPVVPVVAVAGMSMLMESPICLPMSRVSRSASS